MENGKLEVGRELNALIARKVLGWIPWEESRGGYTYVVWQKAGEKEPWCQYRDAELRKQRYKPLFKFDPQKHIEMGLPDFSHMLGEAMEAAEKLNCLQFTLGRENCCGVRYDASFYDRDDCTDRVNATADTAPHAICLAMLQFVTEHRNS